MSNNTNTPDNNNSPDVEILGQKFSLPSSNIKLIGFIVLLIAATIITLQAIKYGYTFEKGANGWTFKSGRIAKNKDLNKGFIMSFWTPSDSTCTKKDSLMYNNKEYAWQCKKGPYDSLNKAFGKKIVNQFGFSGFRYMPVLGYGEETKFKSGYWWSIGVTDRKCDEKFLEAFKNTYIKFWSPKADWDELYVEIIGSR